MSDSQGHSGQKTIGEEAMRRLIGTWVDVKIVLLEKLKRRIEDENDVEKLKKLREELNEVLLNDADLAQIDNQFTKILELVQKHKGVIAEIKGQNNASKNGTPHP